MLVKDLNSCLPFDLTGHLIPKGGLNLLQEAHLISVSFVKTTDIH